VWLRHHIISIKNPNTNPLNVTIKKDEYNNMFFDKSTVHITVKNEMADDNKNVEKLKEVELDPPCSNTANSYSLISYKLIDFIFPLASLK
jgi:hypothetical protein